LKNFKKILIDNVSILEYIINISKEKIIQANTNYKRTIIYQNDIYEIIGISWNKDAETTIHEHSRNGCIMILIDGNLQEELYNSNIELIEINNLENINYIDNNIGYHKIKSLLNSLSIHIYSPPNYKANNY